MIEDNIIPFICETNRTSFNVALVTFFILGYTTMSLINSYLNRNKSNSNDTGSSSNENENNDFNTEMNFFLEEEEILSDENTDFDNNNEIMVVNKAKRGSISSNNSNDSNNSQNSLNSLSTNES